MLNEIMSNREEFKEMLAKCIFDYNKRRLEKQGIHNPNDCPAALVFEDSNGNVIPVMCPKCDLHLVDWDDDKEDPSGYVAFSRNFAAGIVKSMEDLAINGIIRD